MSLLFDENLLRIGNTTTTAIEIKLRAAVSAIAAFLQDDTLGVRELR
jgi:hypothetical protein